MSLTGGCEFEFPPGWVYDDCVEGFCLATYSCSDEFVRSCETLGSQTGCSYSLSMSSFHWQSTLPAHI